MFGLGFINLLFSELSDKKVFKNFARTAESLDGVSDLLLKTFE